MSLRILHTADNHIGLSFNQYPEAVRERLIEERFASLGRMVDAVFEAQDGLQKAMDWCSRPTTPETDLEHVRMKSPVFFGEP